MNLVLAVACSLLQGQPEATVEDLIKALAGDDIDAREASAAKLANMGTVVLPVIRKQAEARQGDVRARLLEIAREIERRDRVKEYVRPVGSARISERSMSLRDFAREVQAQTRTQIVIDSNIENEPVNVPVEAVSAFRAVEKLCSAGKSFGATIRAGEFHLASRGVPAGRLKYHDVLALQLTRLWHQASGDLKGINIEFKLAIDSSITPLGSRVIVGSALDEEGKPLSDSELNASPFPAGAFILNVRDGVRRGGTLSGVKGRLEVETVRDIETVTLSDPLRAKDTPLKAPSVTLIVNRVEADDKGFTCLVSLPRDVEPSRVIVRAIDGAGKTTETGRREHSIYDDRVTIKLGGTVPGSELRRLVFQYLVGGQQVTWDWEFSGIAYDRD